MRKASAASSPFVIRPPGLRIGTREPAMGLRGIPEAEIIFEEMAVPANSLVLPPRGLRRGVRGFDECL